MNEQQDSPQHIAIEAKGLSKSYRKHKSAMSRVADFANYLVRGRRSERFFELNHVLRDLDLTIIKGHSLGIIGQNGSGKSTFLKMVASIIHQTSGELLVNGRVASIIELGAGFNPEDTGIQNIINYLTIYGIPKEAFSEKINEIVKFSDLGDKVRTPLKTYSSGMTVRLAFAIIAHLEADILLIDEALAVGDAVFAQKCMRFIKSFRERGTILFVSHDLNALQNLCDEVIWIHGGVIRFKGPARPACEAYLEFTLSADYPDSLNPATKEKITVKDHKSVAQFSIAPQAATIELGDEPDLTRGFGNNKIKILDVAFTSASGKSCAVINGGEVVQLHISLKANEVVASPIIGFLVKNNRGVEIFGENTLNDLKSGPLRFEAGKQYHSEFSFTFPVLPSGDYTVSVAVADGDFFHHEQQVWLHDVLVLRVASERFRYGLIGLNGTTVTVYRDETTPTPREIT